MNINLLTELNQRFESNRNTIWRANMLLQRMAFLLQNPKMDYLQDNIDSTIKDYQQYIEYNRDPKSLIIESKDLVEIGKFGLDD